MLSARHLSSPRFSKLVLYVSRFGVCVIAALPFALQVCVCSFGGEQFVASRGELIAQGLDLAIGREVGSDDEQFVDSGAEFGLGALDLVFGSGDVEPGAGDAGQVSGFVGGDYCAFLQAFDDIAPESVDEETSDG